jgi:hypothetical protein
MRRFYLAVLELNMTDKFHHNILRMTSLLKAPRYRTTVGRAASIINVNGREACNPAEKQGWREAYR